MHRTPDFNWYCKTRRDVINNAAYELIMALTSKSVPPRRFEFSIPAWDETMIAGVVEGAIDAVDNAVGYYCSPYYRQEDQLPCYLTNACDNPHCVFKTASEAQIE